MAANAEKTLKGAGGAVLDALHVRDQIDNVEDGAIQSHISDYNVQRLRPSSQAIGDLAWVHSSFSNE